MNWQTSGYLRGSAYVAGLLLLSYLSDSNSNLAAKSTFSFFWVVLIGFIVVYEFILPWMKRSKGDFDRRQVDKELDVFFAYQELLIRDPETRPTHSFDPEFGYLEIEQSDLDQNEEYSEVDDIELEIDDLVEESISEGLFEKLESEGALSKSEFLSLIRYTDTPSRLYKRLSENDQYDRDVILSGVTNMGTFLRYTPEQFRDDDQVVETAVKNGRNAFDFASVRMRSDKNRWIEIWPELHDFLLNEDYPDMRSNQKCGFFIKRMFDVIESDGFRVTSMEPGDAIGFFGQGLVQAICHYKKEYVIIDGQRETYDQERDVGKTVYIERLIRIYFKFITNGDFDDQPFIRITEKYENYDPDSSYQFFQATDFRWYDNYTKSAFPSAHEVFFARLCLDIKQGLNHLETIKPSSAWGK